MDHLIHDVRHAIRGLGRRPLFTLVAVLSLAIGIGATTSIFSVVNSLLLRPSPGVHGADRLVELGRTNDGQGFDTFSYPDFVDLREQATALTEVSAWGIESVSLAEGGAAQRVTGLSVSANYFELLGVLPAGGRFFRSEEDETPGGAPVVVLSHRFWQDRFEGRDVVGQSISLNRHPFTIVGVAPEDFGGHVAGFQVDIWVPLMMRHVLSPNWNNFERRSASSLLVIARMANGVSLQEAQASVSTVMSRLAEAYPETNGREGSERGAELRPLGPIPNAGRGFVGGFLGALAALVTMVLLITCSNVAGMLLARGAAREKEIALRLALGSGRARLVRHLLTEAMLLFVAGGALGLLGARALLGAISAFRLDVFLPMGIDVQPDAGVFAFAIASTLATGVLFGLAPALQATGLDLVPSLKDEAGSGKGRKGRARRVFVTAQLGLSLVLLVSAGLFVRALQRAATVDTGFDARGAWLTQFDLAIEGYDGPEEGLAFHDELLARFRRIPGVAAAALGHDLPLDLSRSSRGVRPEGYQSIDGRDQMSSDYVGVSTGYFSTLGIPLLQGRVFNDADRAEGLAVAVINQRFAEEVWPEEDPLGRTIGWGEETLTVVGVVGNVKNQTVTETVRPMTYRPLAQQYASAVYLITKEGPGSRLDASTVRREVLAVDPAISLTLVNSLEAHTGIATLPQRLGAGVTLLLGVVALLLSGLGVYGVIAFSVGQRIREIGIRMALGAEDREVAGLILGNAVRLALPGLALGGVMATGVGTLLRSFLLGVSPLDPVAFGAVTVLLAALVAIAAWIPARRAAAVNPVDALRTQ